MGFSLIARVLVSAWLIYLAIVDVRRSSLPHWATTIPVLIIGGAAAVVGVGELIFPTVLRAPLDWGVYDALALGLAFLAILLSDTAAALVPGTAAVALAAALGSAQGRTAVFGWLVSLAMSRAGVFGAGDAKVIMILLALYPDPRLAGILLAACGVVGTVLLVRKVGGAAPLLVQRVVKDGLAGSLPARTGEEGVIAIPLTPVLAAGALIYLWLVI